jgi:hypothetical protein
MYDTLMKVRGKCVREGQGMKDCECGCVTDQLIVYIMRTN